MRDLTNNVSQLHNKRIWILAGMAVFLVVSLILGIHLGSTRIPLSSIYQGLFVEREGLNYHIVMNIRLPRVLTGMLVGICLSLSGAILQAVMRNALASPNVIGVSSGAGLAATVCIVLIPQYVLLVPLASFVGAFATTVIIYLLSYRSGIRPLRMVLAGVAVSSFVNATINLILIFFPDRVADTLSFTIGSLSLAVWSDYYRLLPYAVGGILLSFLFSGRLNVMVLGDTIARSLGIHVERSRMGFIALASLLAAASVSVVGLLGFVGLIVPHVVKLLIGHDYKYVVAGSIFVGGGTVILCDTVSRTVAAPMEIPVGIIMALLGVPFFLYLLRGRLAHD